MTGSLDVCTGDEGGGSSRVAEKFIVGVDGTWVVFVHVRPDTCCISEYGDADGCYGGGRDGCDFSSVTFSAVIVTAVTAVAVTCMLW